MPTQAIAVRYTNVSFILQLIEVPVALAASPKRKLIHQLSFIIIIHVICMLSQILPLKLNKQPQRNCMVFHSYHIFQQNRPPMFAILRVNKGDAVRNQAKVLAVCKQEASICQQKGSEEKEKRPLLLAGCCQQLFASKTGNFGDPGAIRTRDVLLRRQALYPAEVRDHILETLVLQGFRAFRSS